MQNTAAQSAKTPRNALRAVNRVACFKVIVRSSASQSSSSLIVVQVPQASGAGQAYHFVEGHFVARIADLFQVVAIDAVAGQGEDLVDTRVAQSPPRVSSSTSSPSTP